jgi:2,4-diketo-3-deoxy-L-fuconate hydrolase
MWLDVNGKRMQSGNTGTVIFDVKTIVNYMSEFTRLEPGDLICTDTLPGVSVGLKPQIWLNESDEVRLGIDGLGEQNQTVVAL